MLIHDTKTVSFETYMCALHMYTVLHFIRKITILEKEYICLIPMYFFLTLEDEIH